MTMTTPAIATMSTIYCLNRSLANSSRTKRMAEVTVIACVDVRTTMNAIPYGKYRKFWMWKRPYSLTKISFGIWRRISRETLKRISYDLCWQWSMAWVWLVVVDCKRTFFIQSIKRRFNCCIIIHRWAIASISHWNDWKSCTPTRRNCDDPVTLTCSWIVSVIGRRNSIPSPMRMLCISIMRSYWPAWICMWWVRRVRWAVRLSVWHRWPVCVRQRRAVRSTRANISKVCLWWRMKLVTSEWEWDVEA